MRYQIFRGVLAVVTVALSFGVWYSVYRAVHDPMASDWIVPGAWFLIFFGILGALVLSVRNRVTVFLTIGASLCTSFVLAFPFLWHVVIILIGWALSVHGAKKIWEDMDSRIHFRATHSLLAGFSSITIAFALVLSGLYFSQIKDFSYDQLIPKLSMNKQVGSMLRNAIISLYPDFKKIVNENTTVDEFLLSFEQRQVSIDAGSLPFGTADSNVLNKVLEDNPQLRQQALSEARKQLSDAVDIPLNGNEQISSVFEDAVNRRIYMFFSEYQKKSSSATLSFVITVVLFFTVLSLAPFLKWVWFFIAAIFFHFFTYFNFVRIVKMVKEADTIVFDSGEESVSGESRLSSGNPFSRLVP